MVRPVHRRGLMAAVAAATAALMTKATTPSVSAAPTNMLTETNNMATTTTFLTASGGGGNGAFNVSNSNGQGIIATTSGGAGFAVNAFSSVAPAINANSSANHGIQGGTSAASVYGLYGSTTGSGGGIFGTGGAAGFGVVGQAGGSQPGVFGQSSTGPGIYGLGGSGVGVSGQSTDQIAVYGISTNSTAIYGQSSSNSQYGVYGKGTNIGVGGEGNTYGVQAFSSAGTALNAQSLTGTAGNFQGKVAISDNLDVSGHLTVLGQKSAAVRDKAGQLRRLYCVEAPDSVFEDYGEGKLAGGATRINLEGGFAGVVHLDHYLVYLTPTSPTPGLYVASRDQTGFEVREQPGGSGEASFCWRVVAKRHDVAAPRLQRVELHDVRRRADEDVRQRSKSGAVITVNENVQPERPNTPDAPELPAPPTIPGPPSGGDVPPPSRRVR